MGILRISNTEFSPESEHIAFRDEVKGAGAIVAFTGIVRGEKQDLSLTLSHYAGFTEKEIIKIVNIMGQECQKQLNKILFYIYDDGSIEKKMFIK